MGPTGKHRTQPPVKPLNTSLRRWRKKRGIQVLALRDDGLSAAEIAARLPLGDSNAVRRVLREAGLPLGLKRAAEKADEILTLRHAGRPVREIAERTGLHQRSIYRFFAEQRARATEQEPAGPAADILPLIWNMQASGVKRKAIALELDRLQIPGPNGAPWTYAILMKFLRKHQQISAALREHKAAAEAIAVLPFIHRLQAEGLDAGAIASRLQGKYIRGMWSKAAVEAILQRAGEALAELHAVVTAAPVNGFAALEHASPQPSDQDIETASLRNDDEAWIQEHVWPVIATLRANGIKTAAVISRELNARGVFRSDGTRWTPREIHAVLKGEARRLGSPSGKRRINR